MFANLQFFNGYRRSRRRVQSIRQRQGESFEPRLVLSAVLPQTHGDSGSYTSATDHDEDYPDAPKTPDMTDTVSSPDVNSESSTAAVVNAFPVENTAAPQTIRSFSTSEPPLDGRTLISDNSQPVTPVPDTQGSPIFSEERPDAPIRSGVSPDNTASIDLFFSIGGTQQDVQDSARAVFKERSPAESHIAPDDPGESPKNQTAEGATTDEAVDMTAPLVNPVSPETKLSETPPADGSSEPIAPLATEDIDTVFANPRDLTTKKQITVAGFVVASRLLSDRRRRPLRK